MLPPSVGISWGLQGDPEHWYEGCGDSPSRTLGQPAVHCWAGLAGSLFQSAVWYVVVLFPGLSPSLPLLGFAVCVCGELQCISFLFLWSQVRNTLSCVFWPPFLLCQEVCSDNQCARSPPHRLAFLRVRIESKGKCGLRYLLAVTYSLQIQRPTLMVSSPPHPHSWQCDTVFWKPSCEFFYIFQFVRFFSSIFLTFDILPQQIFA